jgi:hypothetical protein
MDVRDERHRGLKTVLAAVVLLPCGFALTGPVVGWPNAFRGVLQDAGETPRQLATVACVLGPLGVALGIIWWPGAARRPPRS